MSGWIGPVSTHTSTWAAGASTQWPAVRNSVGDSSDPLHTQIGTPSAFIACISAVYGCRVPSGWPLVMACACVAGSATAIAATTPASLVRKLMGLLLSASDRRDRRYTRGTFAVGARPEFAPGDRAMAHRDHRPSRPRSAAGCGLSL